MDHVCVTLVSPTGEQVAVQHSSLNTDNHPEAKVQLKKRKRKPRGLEPVRIVFFQAQSLFITWVEAKVNFRYQSSTLTCRFFCNEKRGPPAV
jgi:hypothetical protein